MKRKQGSEPALDRRVQRTRRQLRDALVSLILERGWDQVSVLEVCVRADVGRSTFYVHFADKEELLLSGFDELHAALDAVRRASSGSFQFVEALATHAAENRRLHRAIIGRQSGQRVMQRFRDLVVRLVEAELLSLGVEPAARGPTARYLSGGFVELMSAWLERPASMEVSTLVSLFQRLTRGALSAVLAPER